MKKFIAAALFVATQWQPAHAQAILGSIPEELRGDPTTTNYHEDAHTL
jgi:hypothetical protein